jgi:hypothetical protein
VTPPPVVPGEGDARPAAHGWAGWVVVAGVLLILLGAGHVLTGVAALAGHGGGGGLIASPTAWGWTWVVLGSLIGLVGLGVLAGAVLARILGVLLALGSAVLDLASVDGSPGAVLHVVVDVIVVVVVVYALALHGGELRAVPYARAGDAPLGSSATGDSPLHASGHGGAAPDREPPPQEQT